MPAIWSNPSSHWRRGPRRSNWCRVACSRSRSLNCSARASERSATGSRRIARAVWPCCGPKNRDAGQADKPAMRRDRSACDAEAPRRRVEEPELGNAVMREVAEVVRKRPGRRPAAPVEQGEDASGRPSEADVFAQLDDMLAQCISSNRGGRFQHLI